MVDQRDDDPRDEAERDEEVSSATPRPVAGRRGDGEGDAEENDETWTNRPASGGSDDVVADEELLDEEEEQAPAPRKVIQNGRDVLCEELPSRAVRAKLRLRPHLTCVLGVEILSSGERFVFDWKSEEPKVTPVTGGFTLSADSPGQATVVESIISLTEQNLMAVRSGDLNPQVAMLADKIKVKGKVGPAVYLFNLIAPRFQQ